ncbi:PAS domain-containing sensor histidine kinase [Methylocystis sp. L43]|jgi:two-component system nitrogen regulation sensor histidine kinase NtrY|uniref:sensor histidine kinase NtrY-like n=1 Tax=unclassified Methylocystis TaxID=2625913 RepID=UPI0018C1EC02|nr:MULTISPECIES: PAS domain-containing sensor histidine kinase [unclassified Methylocystis]MBG0798201.1 PAS domain-containing sensor histidine kinase [Methylocystis sp. L43]MBG0805714.1 PAS domain-containing sensor histidine kinase [Methylocystis sp. H15]
MALTGDSASPPKAKGRTPFRSWFGPIIVIGAVGCALATFLVVAEFGAISPTDDRLLPLLLINGVFVAVLLAMVIVKAWRLYRVWRRGEAAARLHVRTVGFFAVIALIPAILLAVAGSLTLERVLNPAFMSSVKVFVHNTAEAAAVFRESQCRALLQEAQLTASDLDRAAILYNSDRPYFHQIFQSRAYFLGFSVAALVKSNGEILDRIDVAQNAASIIIAPPQSEFDDARRGEPLCLVIDDGKSFVALRALSAFQDTFLYVTRPIDPIAVEFPKQAQSLISSYDVFDAYRAAVQRAFVLMYAFLTTIMLLSSIWFGLDFADRLVTPIRDLIAATDEVSAGNLDVRVNVDKQHGDLARLGDVFNNMTTELNLQQNRLIEANRINDERREFTEAVLSGVPVAVMGVDSESVVTILNRSAEELSLADPMGQATVGASVASVLPEIVPILKDAAEVFPRAVQSQIIIKRGVAERTLNVRVTSARADAGHHNYVVTLDDITDLVMAQRTSAWADVARRIAHEIKNPLTPIQLSAERLRRKYGKVIQEDRDIFDQCTDTIVRQVDDIKRMVDEFSSFARMPKARPARDDLNECIRQVAFLMRVGNADLDIVEELPETPVIAQFDRRLLSQALTNIVKNAVEGIAAREEKDALEKGRVEIRLNVRDRMAEIDVIDNGKGFPAMNRQRLLEPYMTTRSDGTGLGLPIVAKIVEDHGGRLELLDAPSGRGACVRLVVPLAAETSSKEEPRAAGAKAEKTPAHASEPGQSGV